MLLFLKIHHFALIDELEIEFEHGLNVLTGETGAGKSIILDAIDVVLGGKVNSRMVRTGAKSALIEGTFGITPPLNNWLEVQEIEPLDDGCIICSREIILNGENIFSTPVYSQV